MVSLGEESLFRVESGGTPKSDVEEYWGGGIPWATLVDLPANDFITQIRATARTISAKGLKESSAKMIPANSVIVSTRATIGRIAINRIPIATNQGFKNVIIEDSTRVIPEYVALTLTKLVPTMKSWATGGTFAEISKSKFCELQIPLPPLVWQKEIVAEIEGYQKVINGARAVLDHYRPHIPIHPDWPTVELGTLFETKSGTTPSRSNPAYFEDGTIPWVKTLDLSDGPITATDEKITRLALDETHLTILPVGTVLVAMYGGFNQIGRTGVLEIEATHNQAMTALLPTSKVNPYFLNAILVASKEYWRKVANSTRKDPNITKGDVLAFKIPLPAIATQRAIVAEIESEQELVAANRELITRFDQKIQATLARVWGQQR
jgi:type I restriction enzyme M protein